MNVDETGHFVPEHLAKWLKVSREYLFAPQTESQRGNAVEENSSDPSRQGGGRRRPVPWTWPVALFCVALPIASPAAEPLALQGIMKEMGRNMQVIVDGLSREDFAAAEKAALAIADHPQPPFGEKLRVMGFVGSNAPRFKAFDGETNDHASALARAAKGGDGKEAIAAFARLQSSCLACHQAFRKPFQEHFYGKAEVR